MDAKGVAKMDKQDIVAENISKSFGEKVVLSSVNARFPHGKKSSIMAASGKGKTTLFRIFLGLEVPDSGMVHGVKDKKIAAVFQEDRLCENLSAMVNISLVSKANHNRIREGLAKMGLLKEADAPVSTLSGGMKRRVAILRALMSDADILLLDEPFKGLDEETKTDVIKLVKQYTEGKTVILITHSESERDELETQYDITL